MAKITQSYILRCGFEYHLVKNIKENHKLKYTNLQKKYKNIWNIYYTKNVWVYDVELDGEIEVEILCFKTFGAWVFKINNAEFKLNRCGELENLIPIYPNEKLNFIYIIQSELGVKIGRTKNIDNRANIFNVKLPFDWHFYKIFAIRKTKKMEKFLHFILKNYHKNGEWFDLKMEDLIVIDKFISNNK